VLNQEVSPISTRNPTLLDRFNPCSAHQIFSGVRDRRRPDLARALDVFATGDICYVLTNTAPGSAAIFRSRDGARSWIARATFEVSALARSAELLDGYFYVGLGCKWDSPCGEGTGDLLRVEAHEGRD
jgi:hypothetical protein